MNGRQLTMSTLQVRIEDLSGDWLERDWHDGSRDKKRFSGLWGAFFVTEKIRDIPCGSRPRVLK